MVMVMMMVMMVVLMVGWSRLGINSRRPRKAKFSKSLDSSPPDPKQQSLLIGWWSNLQTFNGGRAEKTSFFHNDFSYHHHQHRRHQNHCNNQCEHHDSWSSWSPQLAMASQPLTSRGHHREATGSPLPNKVIHHLHHQHRCHLLPHHYNCHSIEDLLFEFLRGRGANTGLQFWSVMEGYRGVVDKGDLGGLWPTDLLWVIMLTMTMVLWILPHMYDMSWCVSLADGNPCVSLPTHLLAWDGLGSEKGRSTGWRNDTEARINSLPRRKNTVSLVKTR